LKQDGNLWGVRAMYTVEQLDQWVVENRAELINSSYAARGAHNRMKVGELFKSVWCCGCWLEDVLNTSGASNKQMNDLTTEFTGRAFGTDGKELAVQYINAFIGCARV